MVKIVLCCEFTLNEKAFELNTISKTRERRRPHPFLTPRIYIALEIIK